jgi:hypothetical protein
MNRMKRYLCITLCVILAVIAFEELLFWGPARRAQHKIENSDKPAIVRACRQLMAERSTYTNEGEQASWMTQWITIKRGSMQYNTRLPAPITNLDPIWVLIGTNRVMIGVRPPPCRVYLHAFADGSKQEGKQQLADGLWY